MLLQNELARFLFPVLEKYQERDILSKVHLLQEFEILSRKQKDEYVFKKIKSTLEICHKYVPYYRELFKEIDFNPEDFNHINVLEQLPHLTKDHIREFGQKLLNENLLNKSRIHPRKTGGSTGQSVIIYYDQESLDWTSAVNLYVMSFTGKNFGEKEVHISTDFKEKFPLKDRVIESIKCLSMNRNNLMTSSFDERGMSELLVSLKESRPYLVQGHPSTFYNFALYLKNSGLGPLRKDSLINAIESTGETLEEKKCNLIEEQLGCKVYNRFGNAEFGVIAHSRETPFSMEFIEQIAYPEMFKTENFNELVLTTLENNLMPMIRYKTGDVATLISKNGKKYLTNVSGRIHDLIYIKGVEYPTHYVQDVLDRVSFYDDFQFHLFDNKKPILKIVFNKETNKEAIKNKINEVFGINEVDVQFVEVTDLKLQGWREKFRYVVRH